MHDIDAADRAYREAVQLMPRHGEFIDAPPHGFTSAVLLARGHTMCASLCVLPASVLGNFAVFCHRHLGNMRKVRAVLPTPYTLWALLWHSRDRIVGVVFPPPPPPHGQANALFRRALLANPKHANNNGATVVVVVVVLPWRWLWLVACVWGQFFCVTQQHIAHVWG